MEHAPLFTDLPVRTTLEEAEVVLLEDAPVRIRRYPLPHATMDIVRKEVETMLRLGVIEPCVSPYSAPMVLIHKRSGKIRFSLDFRARIVRFDTEPLPDVELIFASLSHAKCFSKLDMTKGYWQVPERLEDKDKLAFTTPHGQFRWVTVPFGLKTAGAIFSRMMRKLLGALKRDDIYNVLDDVLIATAT